MDTKDAGKLGGLQRAKNLTQQERRDAARRAAIIRWARPRPKRTKKVAA